MSNREKGEAGMIDEDEETESSLGEPRGESHEEDEEVESEETNYGLYVLENELDCPGYLDEYLTGIFKVLKEKGVDPTWITTDEICERQQYYREDIYVLHTFSGRAFDHLRKFRFKIFGPIATSVCIKEERSLPKADWPQYSLAFQGSVVCFTGIERRRRAKLVEKVQWMGGLITGDLHDQVNVLVAERCENSAEKYIASMRLGIPLVTPEWITESWKRCSEELCEEKLNGKDVLDRYRVPLFKGMEITVSGLIRDERANVATLIESQGGRFCPEMKRDSCTHLICNNNSGEKYKKAREWGSIKIVELRWLEKSVERGYVQLEKHFDPDRVRSSTPTKNQAIPLDDLELSMIARVRGDRHMNNSTVSLSFHSSPPTNSRESAGPSRDGRPLSLSVVDATTASDHNDPSQISRDPLAGFNFSLLGGDSDFLEGVRVFPVGVEESMEGQWRKFLNLSGGTLASRIENATHVVVVSMNGAESRSLTRSVPVVSADWLIACAAARSMLPITDYIWDERDERRLLTTRNAASSSQLFQPASRLESARNGGMTEIRIGSDRSQGEAPSTRSAPMSSTLFRGMSFKVVNMNIDQEEKICELITSASGEIVKEWEHEREAVYLVCSLLQFGAPFTPIEFRCQDMVTINWLESCLERGELDSPSSHPLFRPIPAVRGSLIFQELMISVSGFSSKSEKLTLTSLLETFGATVQSTICWNKTSSQLRSTHVVAGASSSKWARASSFGILVVDPSWVVESIIQDRRLVEHEFMFKERAYSLYGGREDDWWRWEEAEERRTGQPAAALDDTVVLDPMEMERRVAAHQPAQKKSERMLRPRESMREMDSPASSQFLRQSAKPRIFLSGAMDFVNEMSSPCQSLNTSPNTLSTTMIGRMLSDAVEKTGRLGLTTPEARRNQVSHSAHNSHRSPTQISHESEPQETESQIESRLEVERKAAAVAEKRRLLNERMSAALSCAALGEGEREVERRAENGEKDATNQFLSPPRPPIKSLRKRFIEMNAASSPNEPPRKKSAVGEGNCTILSHDGPRVEWQESVLGRTIDIPSTFFSDSPLEEVNASPGREAAEEKAVVLTEAAPSALPPPAEAAPSALPPPAEAAPSALPPPAEAAPSALPPRLPPSAASPPPMLRSRRSGAVPSARFSPPPPSVRSSKSTGNPLASTERVIPIAGGSKTEKIRRISRGALKKYRFAFTSMPEEERQALLARIDALGGEFYVGQGFDPQVTHLVCSKLMRSERLLSAMAQGQWVMHPSFITKSSEAGRWLLDEDFEWGKLAAGRKVKLAEIDDQQKKLAISGRKWRRKLEEIKARAAEGGQREVIGAFAGWKAVFYVKQRTKITGLQRLVQAGGGTAQTRESIVDLSSFSPTHCLVDLGCEENVRKDESLLRQLSAKAFYCEFLSHFLLDDKSDDVSNSIPSLRF